VYNAYTYLHKDSLERSFLFEPDNVDGTLADNGANWLWIRWLVDHFAVDSVIGTDLTRTLDGAGAPGGQPLTGRANLEAATGASVPELLGQWQAANYLAGAPGGPPFSGRLRYSSWDLDSLFTTDFGAYPLVPDSTVSGTYTHAGTLRQGSGRHLRVIRPPSSGPVDVTLTDPSGDAIAASVAPRLTVVRIR
jgi:hypothetical protein